MQIIEYVDTQVIPNFAKQPKNTLEEMKKWNNIMNFRKSTPEVKKIREHVVSHMSQVYENIEQSLQKVSKKTGEPLNFVTLWREGSGEVESLKQLVNSILETPNPDINTKFSEYKSKFEALIKKFCSKIEDDTEKMRSQDQRSFEQTTGRRIDLSLEEEVYAFVSPSLKADEFSQLLQKMKQFKLDEYFSQKFRAQVNEQLKIRETTTFLRQIMQSFMFHIEKVEEGLLEIVKSDTAITALMKTLTKKQDGEFLIFKDADDAEGFLKDVK